MTTVHDATREEMPRISKALARAFDDDPVMKWIFGDSPKRHEHSRQWFEMEGKRHLEHDRVLTTDDCVAAAYWAPPDQWRVPVSYLLRTGPATIRLIGRRLP